MKRNFTRSNKNDKVSFLKNKNFKKENKNEFVKNSLSLKANQLVLSGKHAALSALRNTKRRLFYLISTKDHYKVWEKNITDLGLSIEVKIKTKEQLDIINNFKPHQNVILIVEHLKRISLDEFLTKKRYTFKKPLRIIILDQVSDPQNVGAIIRSAYAFKMNALALSQTNSPIESTSMSKASSGAIEKLEIIELSNMSRAIKKLQNENFRVYGLAHGGDGNIFDLEEEVGNVAIIVGSEGKGLRRLTREKVDRLIEIPINPESESLNVSNAASISMFQLQKNFIKI
ncbi:23S rRNA (guanosine(2251)-2'-O)-methyltransferase RlmB [Alphaproteobacteria bacterium]|nr:23S rRNA (guanosine(2251)-2'-O)-methyltransferase RlmB [Alphaproteobacteria bacterium]